MSDLFDKSIRTLELPRVLELLGITPELHWISHLILICLMFFGRVGGLTLIFAALSNVQTTSARLPQERITVG